jgi:glycosyltransferase 2 family protein
VADDGGPFGLSLRRLRPALFVVALLVGVAVVVWRAPDFGEIVAAFRDASWPLLALVVLANGVSLTLRALVWRLTLGQALGDRTPRFRHVVSAHWIGALGNMLFPARAGEAARIGTLTRHVDADRSWPALTGAAAAHRLFEAVPALVLALAVIVLAPVPGWARTALIVGAAVVAVALVVAGVFARGRDDGEGDGGLLDDLRAGLAVVRSPLPVAAAAGAAVAALLAQLAGFWLLLRAFDLDVPLLGAALVLVLSEAVLLVALWPGNVGVYQAVLAGGLLAYGVPYSTGLAYGVAAQAVDVVVAAALGGVGLVAEGRGLRDLGGGDEEPTPAGSD